MNQEITKANVEIVEYLSPSEEKEFNRLETTVDKMDDLMLQSARERGEALSIIKEKGYFKKARSSGNSAVYSDFGTYVKERYHRGRTMGYNYIHIFNVMKMLDEAGFDANELRSIQNVLTIVQEIKRLAKASGAEEKELEALTREALVKGMLVVKNICSVDSNGQPKITQEAVQIAYQTVKEIAINGAYEIDGHQFPLELGKIAVDEQASQMLFEQIQRRRQASYNGHLNGKQRMLESKPQPEEVKPSTRTWKISCPKHGPTEPDHLIQAGFVSACGCTVILQQIEKGVYRFV